VNAYYPGSVVTHLTGVYHADGGLLGEVRYAVGRLAGRTHCGLCDVTHSGVRRKAAWDAAVAALGIQVRLVHLNERTEAVRAASQGRTPCVLAHHRGQDGTLTVTELLGPAELDGLGGDVEAFGTAVRTRLHAVGLVLPTGSSDTRDLA
jgi:hypothetical protein